MSEDLILCQAIALAFPTLQSEIQQRCFAVYIGRVLYRLCLPRAVIHYAIIIYYIYSNKLCNILYIVINYAKLPLNLFYLSNIKWRD